MSHKTHERINDPMLKEDPAATEPRFEGLAINCLVVCVLYIFLVILILCINKMMDSYGTIYPLTNPLLLATSALAVVSRMRAVCWIK